ncbi:MAG: hypothetical protein V9G12_01910 [Microthrixaceae bacterium]
MMHGTYFKKTFLPNEVNIDQPRLDELEDRVTRVYKALKGDETLGPLVLDKIRQGSWPHRTIIRPKAGGEFDADILLKLAWVDDWADRPRLRRRRLRRPRASQPLQGHGPRPTCPQRVPQLRTGERHRMPPRHRSVHRAPRPRVRDREPRT